MERARGNNNYDYLIKAVMVGDSQVGKSCLILREADDSFTTSFITTIGIDFKVKTYNDLNVFKGPNEQARIKAQIWDTHPHQSRYRYLNSSNLRGATAFYVVYDVTDEASFNSARNWLRNLQRGDPVPTIILLGNKADLVGEKAVERVRGQALADEYNLPFFEVSAKTGYEVHEAFKRGIRDAYLRQWLPPIPIIPLPVPASIPAPAQRSGFRRLGSFIVASLTWPFRICARAIICCLPRRAAAAPRRNEVPRIEPPVVAARAIHGRLEEAERHINQANARAELDREKVAIVRERAQLAQERKRMEEMAAQAQKEKNQEAAKRVVIEAKLRQTEAQLKQSKMTRATRHSKRNNEAEDEPPQHLLCPIMGTIMKDPVLLPTGQIGDRSTIRETARCTGKNPYTRDSMTTEDVAKLITVLDRKNEIEAWLKAHPRYGQDTATEAPLRRVR